MTDGLDRQADGQDVRRKLNPLWHPTRAKLSRALDVWASLETVEATGERLAYPTLASVSDPWESVMHLLAESEEGYLVLRGMALNHKGRWATDDAYWRGVRSASAVLEVCRRIIKRTFEGLVAVRDEHGPLSDDDMRRRPLDGLRPVPHLADKLGWDGLRSEYLRVTAVASVVDSAMGAYREKTGIDVAASALRTRPLHGKWSKLGSGREVWKRVRIEERHRALVSSFLAWWTQTQIGPMYLTVKEDVVEPE